MGKTSGILSRDMGAKIRAVTVFCGASSGKEPLYVDTATSFGRELAARGQTLVYGGGSRGMMGAVARGVLEAGGRAVGVIPDFLREKEKPLEGLSELHVVESMHARKLKMSELGDAFAALPGGVGTFEELFEILTWSQLGIHRKPVAVLRVGGFFEPLLALMDGAVDAGFLRPIDRPRLLDATSVPELLDVLDGAVVPPSTILDASALDASDMT